MRIAVTGSIATDHLMTFDGRFADSLLKEQLEKVSLSFLVGDLQIRRGGVGCNIAFGLGNLGLRPLLVGSAGEDFADYRSWLERHHVDCSGVRISQTQHTARFVCTTDSEQAQIASFYPGAMSEANQIELGPLGADAPIDLVVISPNDPEAMLRHTEECRSRGIPFAADPSQQLAWADGPLIRQYVEGATYLFSNDYEAGLIESKTGWSPAEILDRVGMRVTTHGEKGVFIEVKGAETVHVPIVPAARLADPTGIGDAFRAGFLAGIAWGLSPERSAQVGATLATLVLETVGPQEYNLTRASFVERFASVYGAAAAAELEPHLTTFRP
ncbi:carbohydrate kinase family protein [Kineosporia mesophila]|uniref:Carbohydrate kinase family protein n=1 Tax=Kineosporia mesophila TaxID=566012 RepID=A0ABP7A6H8_9ACTN|nr:carbohydrate kinase family protein [Kineosporia mesophila]